MNKLLSKLRNLDWNKVFNISMGIIAVLIIAFSCLYNNNLANLLSSLPDLNKSWLIVACLSIFFVWLIDSVIIKNIARYVYPGKYSIFKAVKTTMIGQYFSSITPFGVAGQPMQLLSLTRQGLSSGIAISLLVSKFLIYQTVLASYSLVVLIYVFFSSNDVLKELLPFAFIGFITQAFTIGLLALFSFNKTITDKIINAVLFLLSKLRIIKNPKQVGDKFRDQLNFYLENNKNLQKDKKLSRKLYFFSFLQITILFSVSFFIYKAYNNDGFPILQMIFSQSYVTMLSSYTPLPGGSGSSEGGFVLAFNMFFDYTVVTQAMLLWRFITYYSCIIFGSFFARASKKADKLEINNTSEQQSSNN